MPQIQAPWQKESQKTPKTAWPSHPLVGRWWVQTVVRRLRFLILYLGRSEKICGVCVTNDISIFLEEEKKPLLVPPFLPPASSFSFYFFLFSVEFLLAR